MHKIIKNQLTNLGIDNTVEAFDGEDGLAKLESEMPVDVVLLDINMPKMDGMTMLRKVRADQRYSAVKIVMVTSESEKAKVLEAIRAGANDYIVKPFQAVDFKDRLNKS
jgi:two-component system chemotaxis response regulator CheY